MRNILICGSPRVGKTNLAKRISEHLGYKYIPLDNIFESIEELPSWPYKKYDDASIISRELSSFVINYINSLDKDNYYVIEGAYLDILNIYDKLDNTLIIGLTYNNLDKETLFKRIKKYDKNEWINKFNDDVILEKCDCFIKRNSYYNDCFNRLKIINYDLSNDYYLVMDNIINDLYKEFIGNKLYIKIDRSMGSHHPKYPDTIYQVNYGYLPNTKSFDDEEIDCYLLGVDKPVNDYIGNCIGIIKRLNDLDNKLIIVPDNINISDEEINKEIDFIEKYYKHIIIRR